ncbi:hypothetical protein [Methylotenera sp. 1P/1]|uniref:hypothetical protein n=1 Tax=Methylotenera sp. 1P/1 TaxID=1131551 RepID=UPI000362BA19|nr:hypothetical protein [Methylotenera sp. 1P/1]
MKRYAYYVIGLLILLGLGAYWYTNNQQEQAPRAMTVLEHVGDECELIAEKAAIALPEALPFQKLEKLARKSRVLQTCMNDRGYIENPAWVKYARPIAAKQAEAQHISMDEAYETLRRSQLKTFYAPANTPLYWIPAKP